MKVKLLPENVAQGIIAFLTPYVSEQISSADIVEALRTYQKNKFLSPAREQNNAITVKEAAKRLSCSPRQIWRLICAGKLKTFKLGARSKRIPASELDKFIAN